MILSELQYFPAVSWISTLFDESYVCFDIYEICRKMSFRNRCLIAGAEGIISLSVPLQDGRNRQLPMNESLISDAENWQARHFKSLRSAYNRSPFFDHYQDELAAMYSRPFQKLAEWDLFCLSWIKEKLDWKTEFRFTDSAIPHGTEEFDDRRNQLLPKNYTRWDPVRYRQVFQERTGFLPNLSVLDLLFNTGPAAGTLLNNYGKKV